MPVILSPGYERDWLKPERSLAEVLHLLRQFPSEMMNAYQVSDMVEKPGVNEIAMIKPVGERLQSEAKPVVRVITAGRYYHKKKDPPSGSWGETSQRKS